MIDKRQTSASQVRTNFIKVGNKLRGLSSWEPHRVYLLLGESLSFLQQWPVASSRWCRESAPLPSQTWATRFVINGRFLPPWILPGATSFLSIRWQLQFR